MPREQRRIFYAGRVQGVGFRFTAERLAREFAVSGWARNLDDGRVELVAEGEADILSAFLDAIDREMRGKIHSTDVETRPPEDEPPLTGFSIRY